MRVIELLGKKVGRLSIVKRLGNTPKGQAVWECVCDCGNTVAVRGHAIGRTTFSCGCQGKDNRLKALTTHGMSKTRVYKIWKGMIKRCKDSSYKRYGGRGIKVCERWIESFDNFHKDMGDIPFGGAQIDRIDNDGDYSPKNCRWADRKTQTRNTSRNKHVMLDGKLMTVAEAAPIVGLSDKTIYKRLAAGWDDVTACTQPLMKNQYVVKDSFEPSWGGLDAKTTHAP